MSIWRNGSDPTRIDEGQSAAQLFHLGAMSASPELDAEALAMAATGDTLGMTKGASQMPQDHRLSGVIEEL